MKEDRPELEFDTPWERLAAGIIKQACEDWRDGTDDKRAGIEGFFYSEWFSILTKVSPDYILKQLRQEDETIERRRKKLAANNNPTKSRTKKLYQSRGYNI